MIDVLLSRTIPAAARADAAVLILTEGAKPEGVGLTRAQRTALERALAAEKFGGRDGEAVLWHAPAGAAVARYLVLGAGSATDFDLDAVRRLFAAAGRRLEKTALSVVAPLPRIGGSGATADVARAAAEGIHLGTHRWEAWISPGPTRRPRTLRRVTLLAPDDAPHRAAVRRAAIDCRATLLARDLVCEAPSTLNPSGMERQARRVARAAGLRLRVINARAAARMGMGCLLGVGRGSADPPRLLHLTYKPRRATRRTPRIALVGKGITFDSGGLDIKPASGMETMKCDMAGSAAVLATLAALPDIGCRAEVHGILMMAENMPSGTAYKPGDILRSLSGRSVEVLNTDAEGRLVLADGLEYARRLKPDRIVDLATLTGACVVALGPQCAGVMGFDRPIVDELLAAAASAGERFWPLPLLREYRPLLDSKVADIKHIGGRWAGAITAGLFLGEFAGRDIPWAHLDIAGPAYAEEDQPLARVGGTGVPVRTLLRWLDTLGARA